MSKRIFALLILALLVVATSASQRTEMLNQVITENEAELNDGQFETAEDRQDHIPYEQEQEEQQQNGEQEEYSQEQQQPQEEEQQQQVQQVQQQQAQQPQQQDEADSAVGQGQGQWVDPRVHQLAIHDDGIADEEDEREVNPHEVSEQDEQQYGIHRDSKWDYMEPEGEDMIDTSSYVNMANTNTSAGIWSGLVLIFFFAAILASIYVAKEKGMLPPTISERLDEIIAKIKPSSGGYGRVDNNNSSISGSFGLRSKRADHDEETGQWLEEIYTGNSNSGYQDL